MPVPLRLVAVVVPASLWILSTWLVASSSGLFRWIGIDYGFYYSQTKALWSGNPASIYDLATLNHFLQELTGFTTRPSQPLPAGPVPYPPLFAWLYTPFTVMDPRFGLALWTTVNAIFAILVARQVTMFFPPKQRLWIGALALTSFPVAYTLFVGQPLLILAWAVGEAFSALRYERDFRAGLVLSVLLVKPQYGLLIGPLLIWKRRWLAVAGAALGSGAILMGSLLVAGPSALIAYPAALRDLSGFRGIGTVAYPEQMINWRAAILAFAPNVDDTTGIVLCLFLGTIGAAVGTFCWRGRWAPKSPYFPQQFALLILVTLVANYHSHVHGTALLLVPLGAVIASRQTHRLIHPIVWAAAIVTTFSFVLTRSMVLVALCTFLILLILALALAVDILASRKAERGDSGTGER